MTDVPSAPEVARLLADALEKAHIPYAVGGAIAYGLHAPPRATNDVDLNIFLGADEAGRALDALEGAGASVERASALRSARERGDFIVRFRGMRIDCFVPSIELSQSAATRVRKAALLGRPISILSAEDLTLFKLLFFRAKDIADVERLVRFQGERLDRAYIRLWLVRTVGEKDDRVAAWDRIVRDSDEQGGRRP